MVTGGLMRARMGGHWWSYENQRVNPFCQNFSKSKFWVLVGKFFLLIKKMSKMHTKLKKKFSEILSKFF